MIPRSFLYDLQVVFSQGYKLLVEDRCGVWILVVCFSFLYCFCFCFVGCLRFWFSPIWFEDKISIMTVETSFFALLVIRSLFLPCAFRNLVFKLSSN